MSDVQQTQSKHDTQAKLLSSRNLQLTNQTEGQDISQQIRQNRQRRIRQVEGRDVYTFGSLLELYRVRRSDRCTLEDTCQNVGGGLADDDCQ